jgi:hypothetical protein
MKKVKVTYMGKRLKDIYPHATKWQVFKYRVRRFFIRVMWILILVGVVVGIFKAGSLLGPKTIIYTKQEVIKEVPIKAPIMERIAKCESPTGHFGKNGQVAVGGNENHTVDIGYLQINSYYWGEKATELGYNLWVEEDNKAMGDWIYQNKGTGPWSSSAKCWNK